MGRTILIVALFSVLVVPLAAAEMIQSGSVLMDLENYTPGDNGDVLLPTTNLLLNPGFEDGALPPWTTNNWTVTNADANSGVYSAWDIGNYWIRQDFDPVDVGDVISVSMYSKQPEGIAFHAVDFYYSDSDYDEFLVGPGVDWTFINMTGQLRAAGALQAIRIWGYSGGGPDDDLTQVDDVVVEIDEPTATEETSWGRVKGSYR